MGILEKLKSSFDANVLGSAVSVYYAHWEQRRTAAGEIKALEVEYDSESGKYQLLGDIEWTKKGMEAVKDKEYKYISSEVVNDFVRDTDSSTTVRYGPVLTGAALVNEPGVWDIPQIVFSGNQKFVDRFTNRRDTEPKTPKLPTEDDVEELLKKLGFASGQELEAAFNALKTKAHELESGQEKSKFEACLRIRMRRLRQ